MNSGLVSVVIPVYNVEKYLRDCLDSVLSQTYTDFEVLLIDDGSTDSSKDICKYYCDNDSRFRLITKANGGASSARNIGIKEAEGKYIFFVDSDDILENCVIKKLVCCAEKEQSDIVFFEAVAFDDTTGKSYKNHFSYRKKYDTDVGYKIMRDMTRHGEFHVPPWMFFIKKDLLTNNAITFCEGVIYEDMLYAYQIFTYADKVSHIHEFLYRRRFRENSVTTASKTEHNFNSSYKIYKEVVKFSLMISAERVNSDQIIRCAYNALNNYRALDNKYKASLRRKYTELKKDILSYNAFSDKALKYLCNGYVFWFLYKVIQKLFVGGEYHFDKIDCDKRQEVVMIIPHMVGGGAERVAAQIVNQMNEDGYHTRFILSADKYENVVRSDLNKNTPLILLQDEMPKQSMAGRLLQNIGVIISSLICKPFEMLNLQVPASFAKLSVLSHGFREYNYIKRYLKNEPDLSVITFLQPTISITLLAARKLPNKIIVSERADPNRLMKKRYGYNFIKKYYTRADKTVFQTIYAKEVYPKNIADNGVVITNPLKNGLPEPYFGERNKNITTFCRISNQKNLPLLIDAFAKLHADFPDYNLRIIGDAPDAEGEAVIQKIRNMVDAYGISDSVKLEPFQANVHKSIIKDAMYVSSSDYEGISNAMLEALAIGMPCVCTDCPIGGARTTITDSENGLLVPIKDADELYNGMKRLIEDKALSDKLSKNASLLRESLALDKITKQWENLLF